VWVEEKGFSVENQAFANPSLRGRDIERGFGIYIVHLHDVFCFLGPVILHDTQSIDPYIAEPQCPGNVNGLPKHTCFFAVQKIGRNIFAKEEGRLFGEDKTGWISPSMT
jgi:hypothetical protein